MNVLRRFNVNLNSIAKIILHVNVKDQGILCACDIINFGAWLTGYMVRGRAGKY